MGLVFPVDLRCYPTASSSDSEPDVRNVSVSAIRQISPLLERLIVISTGDLSFSMGTSEELFPFAPLRRDFGVLPQITPPTPRHTLSRASWRYHVLARPLI